MLSFFLIKSVAPLSQRTANFLPFPLQNICGNIKADLLLEVCCRVEKYVERDMRPHTDWVGVNHMTLRRIVQIMNEFSGLPIASEQYFFPYFTNNAEKSLLGAL